MRLSVFARYALCFVLGSIFLLSGKFSILEASEGPSWPELQLQIVVDGLESPVDVVQPPDKSGRFFVLEQAGRIRIVQDQVLQPEPFLDLSDQVSCCRERGLLGLAFPPDYSEKNYFYVFYTRSENNNTVLARYSLLHTDQADPQSGEILLEIEQPSVFHNGGQLAFGPDGYLYIGTGDGYFNFVGDETQHPAQRTNTLLGKILRIDVETPPSAGETYVIPATNPYVGRMDGSLAEIWALGLRNPWRFSFDRATGELYIADVGEQQFEEINVQPATSPGGENYGWRCREATASYRIIAPCDNPALLNTFVDPVFHYTHGEQGGSIIGGMVYRGTRYPELQGIYVYSDFLSGHIWGLRRGTQGWESHRFLDGSFMSSSFGEDQAGNLYLLDYSGGRLLRLDALHYQIFLPYHSVGTRPSQNEG